MKAFARFLYVLSWTAFCVACDGGSGCSQEPFLVKVINPGPAPGDGDDGPRYLAVVNGTLFFSADDGIIGRELWAL